MAKKAVITVVLVAEATDVSDDQIKQEIRNDSQISWCDRIESVEIIKE